jgi:rubrerythrin
MPTDGKKMYLTASNAVSDIELKDTFRFLAKQEETHKERFERLKKDASDNQSSDWRVIESFPSKIVESVLFREDSAISRAINVVSADEAIDFALRFEEATVSFYERILDSALANARTVVQKILNEEKNHVRILRKIQSKEEHMG